ncbi:MAG: hypothetical protein UR85_C0003G0094 [Candidatus Nomurabacteria bacterium GW2011_GWF2_35_66]|uniref:Uncharacterized protein n=1 Tax=Candidatus Nomurabacteria bacterium GW2011_GWE1_35_16 TaxID=1618761 RepID=A0A0G0BPQ8_9BACT|nr:MAG: hypothetical protein UR55_C0005G0093 [Candidatus Nomurabacteria bacterium GW2011_GWF1_34_20]KKP63421.1 MAG: hypothetical protein UR57_C0005G0093 [Candidatus Nomurabacteria bacterium GW2011_GWE2_34_25]KKP65611.1 MAG: hypothetical protein UR64_C0023G0006 [Candidatus Nomurabacteria bacterium GW2011_GWE1_35_16]KKP83659.1 MAG: hypothetical protein UR85_C0003G0094 [Candidatus Nomurabacteria bacterium GW2011_GWF2_35_66]HAE36917.1 hypothetical protein [Candidatus Nomurabacteria bacterium]
MLKKILYAIVIIVIIIILAIMWNGNKKEVVAPVTSTTNDGGTLSTEPSLSNEIDSINLDAGIDADLNSMDADIKTL